MTCTVLKLALAKMLPEVHTDDRPNRFYDFYWAEHPLGRGRGIEATEWDCVVRLAEAKLTDREQRQYLPMIHKLSPWNERAIALCHTKGIKA